MGATEGSTWLALVHSGDADVLVFRRAAFAGAGLLGALCVVMGVAFVALSAHWCGLFLIVFGAVAWAPRLGTTIGKRQRQVTVWWGLLVPFSWRTHDLDSFTGFHVESRELRSRWSSYTAHYVYLRGKAGEELLVDVVYDTWGSRPRLAEIAGELASIF